MNKLRIFLVLAVSALMVSTASAQSVNDIIEKYNEGAQYLKSKQYDQSIAALKSAQELAQSSTEEEAIDLKDKVTSLLGLAYQNKGKQLAGSRQFDQALVEFGQAEGIFTELNDIRNLNMTNTLIAKTYEIKAATQHKEGDIAGAIVTSEEGLARNPNSTDLTLFLAKLKYTNGDTDGALALYQGLYDMAKRSSRYAKVGDAVDNALMANAAESAQEGKTDLAEQNITLVLTNDPTNEIAQMQRIQIYNAAKDYRSVIKYADEAIAAQQNPENKATLNFIAGAAYQVLEDNDNAVKHYNQVNVGRYVAQAKDIVNSLNKK